MRPQHNVGKDDYKTLHFFYTLHTKKKRDSSLKTFLDHFTCIDFALSRIPHKDLKLKRDFSLPNHIKRLLQLLVLEHYVYSYTKILIFCLWLWAHIMWLIYTLVLLCFFFVAGLQAEISRSYCPWSSRCNKTSTQSTINAPGCGQS